MVVVLQFPFEFLDTFHLSLSGSDKFLDFLIQFFIRVGHLKLGSPYLFCGAVSFLTCTTSTIQTVFWRGKPRSEFYSTRVCSTTPFVITNPLRHDSLSIR